MGEDCPTRVEGHMSFSNPSKERRARRQRCRGREWQQENCRAAASCNYCFACPYVRLVPGACDHLTGDRLCPDPVWETAVTSLLPRLRPLDRGSFPIAP